MQKLFQNSKKIFIPSSFLTIANHTIIFKLKDRIEIGEVQPHESARSKVFNFKRKTWKATSWILIFIKLVELSIK